jgi:hypothetical protein
MAKEPTFGSRTQLVRYVDPLNRQPGNRPAFAAFLPDEVAPGEEESNHLSVNSLELESLHAIAAYHRWRAQEDQGPVALTIHKVVDYNDAANKSNARIAYNHTDKRWEFAERRDKVSPAYRYRPVRRDDYTAGSPSRCGVEYVRVFDEYAATRFARRLSEGRFQVVYQRRSRRRRA